MGRGTIRATGSAANMLFQALAAPKPLTPIERNQRRNKVLQKRYMRIGCCFDLAGMGSSERHLPEGLLRLVEKNLDVLKSVLGQGFSALIEEVPEPFCNTDEVAEQFCYAVEDLGLHGFLIEAQQQSPPDDSGRGTYVSRYFYNVTYEDAVLQAVEWAEKNIEKHSTGAAQ